MLNERAVLVAGGAGFVGSALVRALSELGARVVSFDNYRSGHRNHLRGLRDNVALVEGDALDPLQLVAAMRRHEIEYVFDLIGDTFVPDAYQYPQRFFDINVLATLNVLRAAHECRVRRVLYASSTEVYGDIHAERADEATPLAPVNTYAVSKLAADRLCHTFHLEHGLHVTIARIFNCFGPRATQPYVIPDIVQQLDRGPVIQLGNVDAHRDFTYVDDTARALIAVMASDLRPGDVVNVGSGTAYSIRAIAEALAAATGVHGLEIVVDESRLRRRDIDRFCCDNRKLRSLTGWAPAVSLEDGLRRTVQSYRENGRRWCWTQG